MKTKELSEVEQMVETFVTVECAVPYAVIHTGAQKRDGWECDSWKFTLKGESFEYFTGPGHRVDTTESKFARVALKNVSRNSIAWVNEVENKMTAVIPPVAGILYSIILDSSANEQSFASWCAEVGYSGDSRKALANYEACQENGDKLHKVFTHAQIGQLKELLQDY